MTRQIAASKIPYLLIDGLNAPLERLMLAVCREWTRLHPFAAMLIAFRFDCHARM